MLAAPRSNGILDLETLLSALPACKRCRSNRRSYIASLVDHLKRGRPSPRSNVESAGTSVKSSESDSGVPCEVSHNFAYTKGAYRFLGDGSPLSTVREQPRAHEPTNGDSSPALVIPEIKSEYYVDTELHQFLVQTFFKTINQVYSILEPDASFLSHESGSDEDLPPTQQFVLQLVYAIGCHCVPEFNPKLISLAHACHHRALQHIETATAEPTIVTLQAITLLAVYSLFEPEQGNFSQQIGFAVRLAIDLAGSETFDAPPLLTTLQTVIYCLENLVCSVLVRPTSLQEPARPATFDINDPLEFLCSLCRAQKHIQNGDLEPYMREAILNIDGNTLDPLLPNVTAVFWQTRLMLEDCSSNASILIGTYCRPGFIPTFLTAHWINRATRKVIEGYHSSDGVEKESLLYSYSSAIHLLGSLSTRWAGSKIIAEELQSVMREGGKGNLGPDFRSDTIQVVRSVDSS
ncbi:hypothetical protein NA57DRAFT_59872 [Rhizodiscina lignyota]|uniref:Xylanolytic transcriptional activator regulatory domain-containing protein n=1 Tax=Rhizodiscina lignyota TaxID=1504668 RepID=A0A9P4M2Y9_9PEZI|nr:hypothetical protein NA57DRAFT_59872 [Rhizodiscina lignyota]